jgi:hypothetical protein
MGAKEYLVDWTVDFLKNKDLMLRRIEDISKNKGGYDVYVKYKDKEQNIVVMPTVEDADALLSRFNENGHFGLVLLNTNNNFRFLIKNWERLLKFRNLCIYFVNPFSSLDKKWIIYPYTHNNVCESTALEKGLRSMLEMVDVLSEGAIKDKFK